jgi:hypothetical protein
MFSSGKDQLKKELKSYFNGPKWRTGKIEMSENPNQLLKEIQNKLAEQSSKSRILPVDKEDLLYCYEKMFSKPSDTIELFQYISALNVINFWSNRNKKDMNGEYRILNEIYAFKKYLFHTIETILPMNFHNVLFGRNNDHLTIELFEFQFSFKQHISIESASVFSKLPRTVWKGQRLQRVSPLLLRYSHLIRNGSTVQ